MGLALTALIFSWSLGSSGVDQRYVGQWIDKEGTVTNLNADGTDHIWKLDDLFGA